MKRFSRTRLSAQHGALGVALGVALRVSLHVSLQVSTRVLVAGAMVGLVACGGGGDGTGPTVTPPTADRVARIDLTSPSTTIAVAQTVQVTATAKTATGTSLVNVTPSWSSSAPAVATVSQSGVVSGVAPGSTTISATLDGISGTATVTVTSSAGVLSSIVLTAQDRTIELGGGVQVTVTGRDAQGGAVALGARTVTWTSSNPSIARISTSGFASGVGVGNADLQVTVLDGTVPRTASLPLTVVGIAGAPLTARITMLPMDFLPEETLIRQNGTVSFVFPTLAHNVIWDRRLSGAPTDIGTTSNVTITRVFPTAGVFDYVCTLHPGMEGRIIVSP